MPNVHLTRLLAVVSTLAQGSWVKVPYRPIGGGLEANEAFMVTKDPSDGCVCVLHVMYTRTIGDIEHPPRLDAACAWSLGEMLSYLVELDEETLTRVDAGLEKVQLGGSDTLRDLAVLCQQTSGPYDERIAAENVTLTFDGDVPLLTAEGEAKWSLNATVMMIRQGR
jgi:hypothetical protein